MARLRIRRIMQPMTPRSSQQKIGETVGLPFDEQDDTLTIDSHLRVVNVWTRKDMLRFLTGRGLDRKDMYVWFNQINKVYDRLAKNYSLKGRKVHYPYVGELIIFTTYSKNGSLMRWSLREAYKYGGRFGAYEKRRKRTKCMKYNYPFLYDLKQEEDIIIRERLRRLSILCDI